MTQDFTNSDFVHFAIRLADGKQKMFTNSDNLIIVVFALLCCLTSTVNI